METTNSKKYRAEVLQERKTWVYFSEDEVEDGDSLEVAASELAFEQGDWELIDEWITVEEDNE